LRPPVKFEKFLENQNLCVFTTLESYLERSKSWRKTETQLLLSFISPHKAESTSTISRWIVEVLKLSGIDTDSFKAHSTRSAVASKAKKLGISTKEIIKRGNWSNESTFQKFYAKQIEGDDFQENILKLT